MERVGVACSYMAKYHAVACKYLCAREASTIWARESRGGRGIETDSNASVMTREDTCWSTMRGRKRENEITYGKERVNGPVSSLPCNKHSMITHKHGRKKDIKDRSDKESNVINT